MKKFHAIIFCLFASSVLGQNDPKNFLIEFYDKPDNPNTIYDISSSQVVSSFLDLPRYFKI